LCVFLNRYDFLYRISKTFVSLQYILCSYIVFILTQIKLFLGENSFKRFQKKKKKINVLPRENMKKHHRPCSVDFRMNVLHFGILVSLFSPLNTQINNNNNNMSIISVMEIFDIITISFRKFRDTSYGHFINILYNVYISIRIVFFFIYNHDSGYRTINYLVGSCDGSEFYNNKTNKNPSINGIFFRRSFNPNVLI